MESRCSAGYKKEWWGEKSLTNGCGTLKKHSRIRGLIASLLMTLHLWPSHLHWPFETFSQGKRWRRRHEINQIIGRCFLCSSDSCWAAGISAVKLSRLIKTKEKRTRLRVCANVTHQRFSEALRKRRRVSGNTINLNYTNSLSAETVPEKGVDLLSDFLMNASVTLFLDFSLFGDRVLGR